ncbi:sensor histidine kinase [Sphingomonas sp. UYP23]
MAPLALYAATLLVLPMPVWAIAGTLAGLSFLIVLWFAAARLDGTAIIPLIVIAAAIGMALASGGGAWSLFFAYGAAMAGRIRPRSIAIAAMAALGLTLVAYGAALALPLLEWGPGLLFGATAGMSAMHRRELELKNGALAAANLEIRHLAAVAERERIARDLHDLLGQTLTLVAIKADLAKRLIGRDDVGAAQEVGDIAEAARTALAEVRAAVSGMRSSSIGAELSRASSSLQAAGIAASLPHAVAAITPGGEAVLAMVLREAVTNVIRHSGATICRVEVERLEDDVTLTVEDDGDGSEMVEGWGLTGMRGRLAAAGGELSVAGGRDGTRIIAKMKDAEQ